MQYSVNILGLGQLGFATAELARRVGLTVTPSSSATVIGAQLKEISVKLNVEVDFRPFHAGLLNAVYYWLNFYYERQQAVH